MSHACKLTSLHFHCARKATEAKAPLTAAIDEPSDKLNEELSLKKAGKRASGKASKVALGAEYCCENPALLLPSEFPMLARSEFPVPYLQHIFRSGFLRTIRPYFWLVTIIFLLRENSNCNHETQQLFDIMYI